MRWVLHVVQFLESYEGKPHDVADLSQSDGLSSTRSRRQVGQIMGLRTGRFFNSLF